MTTNKLGLFERSRLSKYMIQGQFSQILLKLGIEGKSILSDSCKRWQLLKGFDPKKMNFLVILLECEMSNGLFLF